MFYRRIYIGFHCLRVLIPHLHDIYFGYHDFSTAHGQLYDIPALKLCHLAEFFIVAVLISLTTATRMVEEDFGIRMRPFSSNSLYTGFFIRSLLCGPQDDVYLILRDAKLPADGKQFLRHFRPLHKF